MPFGGMVDEPGSASRRMSFAETVSKFVADPRSRRASEMTLPPMASVPSTPFETSRRATLSFFRPPRSSAASTFSKARSLSKESTPPAPKNARRSCLPLAAASCVALKVKAPMSKSAAASKDSIPSSLRKSPASTVALTLDQPLAVVCTKMAVLPGGTLSPAGSLNVSRCASEFLIIKTCPAAAPPSRVTSLAAAAPSSRTCTKAVFEASIVMDFAAFILVASKATDSLARKAPPAVTPLAVSTAPHATRPVPSTVNATKPPTVACTSLRLAAESGFNTLCPGAASSNKVPANCACVADAARTAPPALDVAETKPPSSTLNPSATTSDPDFKVRPPKISAPPPETIRPPAETLKPPDSTRSCVFETTAAADTVKTSRPPLFKAAMTAGPATSTSSAAPSASLVASTTMRPETRAPLAARSAPLSQRSPSKVAFE
mmetsp:Transcript_10328/g.34192  ORF Transcript_10328/g.34192 Transcript_10328/m.34192 type:complete len:434 (-) Transcript_10328:1120-2421(-)